MTKRIPSLRECLAAVTPSARVFHFEYPGVDPNHPSDGQTVPTPEAWQRIKDELFTLPGIWQIQGFYSGVVILTFHASAVTENGKPYTDDDYRAMIAAIFHDHWQ